MKRARFLMIGGFLGAGKTTTIARLARYYLDRGHKVGIVTNDQAYDLVDTRALRAQGFEVGEVPGACFCCKFNDLIETASTLQQSDAPDIILAEPVGSCTDLVATVVEPLRHLYGEQYEVGPLAVLLKPEHGRKILRQEQGLGFSRKAAYIFLKQLEEADVVVINKVDKLSAAERDELLRLVKERYPQKEVIAASARRGDGFDALIEDLGRTSEKHVKLMDVDYDVYAAGEAELGWLNCQVHVESEDATPFALDDLLVAIVTRLRNALLENAAEAAHLKVLGEVDHETAIANLVGSGVDVELSLASGIKTSAADLIVNARVATSPEDLQTMVEESIESVAEEFELRFAIRGMQRFRPGRPVPTHRMTTA
jgi:G3E family GTPase